MDAFQKLLWDLGEHIHLPLHVDKHNACSLLLDDLLEIQLQMDSYDEHLILWAYLHDVPPGRYRENVLKEALKFNSLKNSPGTLAFYEKKNLLILQNFLPIEMLSGEKLVKQLEVFIEKADEWRLAIEDGHASPSPSLPPSGRENPFFLRP